MLLSIQIIGRIQLWGFKIVENNGKSFEKWESKHTESLLISGENQANVVDYESLLDPIHMFLEFLHSSSG